MSFIVLSCTLIILSNGGTSSTNISQRAVKLTNVQEIVASSPNGSIGDRTDIYYMNGSMRTVPFRVTDVIKAYIDHECD